MQASFLLMQQFENQLLSEEKGKSVDENKALNCDKELDGKIENLLLYDKTLFILFIIFLLFITLK